MKLTTIYADNIVDRRLSENNTLFPNDGSRFSQKELKFLLGNPTYDYSRNTKMMSEISWYILDEESDVMYCLWVNRPNLVDEEIVYWRISVTGKDIDIEEANELAEKLIETIKKGTVDRKPVAVKKPTIRKSRVRIGTNEPFCIVSERRIAEDCKHITVRELDCEYNSDSKFYKRFYSKLSPELKAEFDMMTASAMRYIEYAFHNMPEHYFHAQKTLYEILDYYNDDVIISDREKRAKLKNKKK